MRQVTRCPVYYQRPKEYELVLRALCKGPVLESDFPELHLANLISTINNRILPEGRRIVSSRVKVPGKFLPHYEMRYRLK